MHATNNSKSLVACEINDCELIFNSLDLSLVYLQLQLEKLSLTHLTKLNYLQLAQLMHHCTSNSVTTRITPLQLKSTFMSHQPTS